MLIVGSMKTEWVKYWFWVGFFHEVLKHVFYPTEDLVFKSFELALCKHKIMDIYLFIF